VLIEPDSDKATLINSENVIMSGGKNKISFFFGKNFFFQKFCFHHNSMPCFPTALKVASLDSAPRN